MYEYVKQISTVASAYYPETLGVCFIINAPMLFAGVWKIIKGFLDEKTRSKIQVLGGNYLPTLAEYVDVDELPKLSLIHI